VSKVSAPPVISVVSVVYDAKWGLQQTLERLQDSPPRRVQVVVVDGGSTDGTLDVIQQSSNIVDMWVSEPDRGISDAFNKGASLVKGQFVGFLNAGDWYEPDALDIVEEAFRAHADVDVLCGAIRFWERGKATVLCHSDPGKLEYETSVYHPTVFIKKSAYEKFGLYDETYLYAMDYELLLRFKRKGARFLALDHVLANMTLDGVSSQHWYEGLKEVRRARSMYFPLYDVLYRHVKAVAMNVGARALKKAGLTGLYQLYWQGRNRSIASSRARDV
jgi:glycosyltransferase involved in cell wall biosynthesis